MDRDQTEGSWRQFTGKLRERWGVLTGDTLLAAAGRREQLAGRIQERRGISRHEAACQLRDFKDRNRNWYLLNR